MPAAAKKVVSAAESMGFTVETKDFTFHKDAVLWASTENEHNEGDIRTPVKDMPGVQVVGYRTDSRLGFEVVYAGGFQNAYVLDPVGRYRELFTDYTYGPKEVKDYGYGKEYADIQSQRRDAEYNTGEEVKQFEWWIKAANEFYAWIDEWLVVLKSEHPPIAPKPRVPKATPQETFEAHEQELIAGGEWNG